MSKLTFLIAIAAGFAIGSRAGRGPLERLADSARNVADHPVVQSAAGAVQGRFKR